MKEREDSRQEFEAATARAKALPNQSNEVLLELYGLYKQATAGDAHGDEPGLFDFVAKAKWDAWQKLRGMGRDEAMRAYATRVRELATET